MKCLLFSRKNKKIINLLSAEFACSMLSVKFNDSKGDCLHEISKAIIWEINMKNISECLSAEFFLRACLVLKYFKKFHSIQIQK